VVFELGEGPGEDLGRDSDFAKIVDHRRDPEALSPLRVQIQLLSDGMVARLAAFRRSPAV